jgi:hypothetical protein
MEIEMLVDDGWEVRSWRKFYDRTWKSPIGENGCDRRSAGLFCEQKYLG